jgi:hypothetical protein
MNLNSKVLDFSLILNTLKEPLVSVTFVASQTAKAFSQCVEELKTEYDDAGSKV